ncbi:MAG TPA: ATP-binding protein [Pyrinomonadaceae bacterium]|nr:ATP-binding protein [Pyrinomonadaceae bacterium]
MSVPAETSGQNSTLLIVADDDRAHQRLKSIFQESGYRTMAATDVTSALGVLHREDCDLVVLDLEIPGVDTLALCRLLRAQPATSKLPVIALSGNDDERQKVATFAAGADDYITKPSTPGELISRVGSHLRAAQRQWALIGSNRELRFLSDLGRGLLRALEPEQLVRRVAGAAYEGTSAALCATYVKLPENNVAVCVFDREGSADDSSLLDLEKAAELLDTTTTVATLMISEKERFLLRDDSHIVEYVAPLRFGGRTNGALIVAFDRREDCGETERRLIDAAAQQTALAAHISSLYQTARESSVSLAREVERRTAEAEAQRRFTQAIIDSLPLSLYAVDRTYRVVAWNRNRELGELGIPRGSVLGRNVFEVLTRQKREVLEREFARVFETGEIERIEQENTSPTGETRYWLISKIPMWAKGRKEVSHVITVGEETTDRVEANRAVARAEKLAAIGRLAAGVVHEINNPLATISACAEALESRVKDGAFSGSTALEDLIEYLGLIRSEAFRCKTITNGLLDFSRIRPTQHAVINLADVISSAARLLSHQTRGAEIKFRIEVPDALPPVSGDGVQLQQAVIALGTNALDAMPEGGVLAISARDAGAQVLVEISDTGIGIQPENITKIFEPFFTTKEVGRGTGLGLAVCYGILTEHGGSLDVQSTVGVGTTFTITLPAVNPYGELQN